MNAIVNLTHHHVGVTHARMRQIITRTWRDTAQSYGLTLGTGIRSILVPITTFLLLYYVLGGPKAVSEAWTLGLSGLAAVAAGFLPLFLWNLWLSPYKILNERLDKVSVAQTSPKVVDEEAARRSHNVVKAESARREMESLRYCLGEREDRRSGHSYHPMGSREFDYDFEALKEKYGSWFPPDFEEQSMKDWAGHIIATLKTNEYDSSVRRIERAVAARSWVEGAPNDG